MPQAGAVGEAAAAVTESFHRSPGEERGDGADERGDARGRPRDLARVVAEETVVAADGVRAVGLPQRVDEHARTGEDTDDSEHAQRETAQLALTARRQQPLLDRVETLHDPPDVTLVIGDGLASRHVESLRQPLGDGALLPRRLVAPDGVEVTLDRLDLAARERPVSRRFHEFERGVEVIASVGRPLRTHPHRGHPERRENRVAQGRGEREEVVVVLRDELADLVDEQPDADATRDRGERRRPPIGQGQHDRQRDHEQQPAPHGVCDVEDLAANLRVTRREQVAARHEDCDDGGDTHPADSGARARLRHRATRRFRRRTGHAFTLSRAISR